MSWIADPAYQALAAALTGLQARTEAVASNLANVDTPGYRPVDVDFEAVLAGQLQAAGINVASDGTATFDSTAGPSVGMTAPAQGVSVLAGLQATDARHLTAADIPEGASALEAGAYLGSFRNDTNAVDVDASMTTLAETQLKYGADTRLLSGQLGMLRDVITSQGGR